MQPHAVVAADDVVSDVARGLGVVGIVTLPNTLHFELQEEALHHRVIPAVALAAHAANQAVLGQQRLMQGAGVLGGFNWSSQHLHSWRRLWADLLVG